MHGWRPPHAPRPGSLVGPSGVVMIDPKVRVGNWLDTENHSQSTPQLVHNSVVFGLIQESQDPPAIDSHLHPLNELAQRTCSTPNVYPTDGNCKPLPRPRFAKEQNVKTQRNVFNEVVRCDPRKLVKAVQGAFLGLGEAVLACDAPTRVFRYPRGLGLRMILTLSYICNQFPGFGCIPMGLLGIANRGRSAELSPSVIGSNDLSSTFLAFVTIRDWKCPPVRLCRCCPRRGRGGPYRA